MLALALISCQKLDGEVEMKLGDVLSDGNVSLEFLDFHDSRCPIGAECFTDGEDAGQFKISDGTSDSTFWIGDGLNYDLQFSGFTKKIDYVTLNPFPEVGKNIKKSKVKVTLRVNKL